MKMFLAGLLTGAVIGSALGVGLMCLLTAGKWADEEMMHSVVEKSDKDRASLKTDTEENQREEGKVDGCGNETM